VELELCIVTDVKDVSNDARTRKLRAGSDFDVIRTSTRIGATRFT